MSNFKFIVFISLITLSGCSINSNKEIPVIMPSATEGELSLADISSDIKYLKLDNQRPIQKIMNVIKFDSLYFVQDLNGIYTYNLNGKFLYEIGKRGKAPGEYNFLNDIDFNDQDRNIYLLGDRKVYIYDVNGKYINSFPTYENERFDMIKYHDSKLVFPSAYNVAKPKLEHQWVITNIDGETEYVKKDNTEEVQLGFSLKIKSCFDDDNKLCYWNQFNDTIFYVNDRGGQPAYLFGKDEYRITQADMSKSENAQSQSMWNLLSVSGSKRYLILDYINIKEKARVQKVFDKKTGKVYELSRSELGKESNKCNTWDGGTGFNPGAKLSEKEGGWLVSWIDAYQLKAHVESESFKNSTPKYPERKKELEQLGNSLNENDNPALMIVKLKN